MDRRSCVALAIIAFLVVGFFFVPLEWRVFDPSMYYAYIRSPLIDGDLDFANEAEPQAWWLSHVERTDTGKFPNVYSIGPALFWTPATLLAHGAVLLLQQMGAPFAADGYALPYLVLVGLTTVLVFFVGLLAVYRLARRTASPFPAFLTTVLVWLATPLFFFSARFNMMAHSFSFATVALFLLAWFHLRAQKRPSCWCWLGLGLLSGLMMLQRWQNVLILLLPPVGDLLEQRILERDRWPGYGLWALGTLLAFSPQMAMWQVLFGRPLLVPQGPDFFHWARPAIGATLFSTNRGLFLWSPLFLLGVAGLVWLWRRDRAFAVAATLVSVLELYMNSAAWDWWGGGAFGPRRFINLLPLLVPGMAGLVARWTRSHWARLALLVLSLLLIWHQWAWMDMVFYVAYSDGGHPLSPEVYEQRYGEEGPWSVEDYRRHLERGKPLPPRFYLFMYDQGLPLPWSVLADPLLRSLSDPVSLLRPRLSRWSSQLPPFFALVHRWKGGTIGQLLASWPLVALLLAGLGLAAAVYLWSPEKAVCWPASRRGKALLLALLSLIALVNVGVLILA